MHEFICHLKAIGIIVLGAGTAFGIVWCLVSGAVAVENNLPQFARPIGSVIKWVALSALLLFLLYAIGMAVHSLAEAICS